MLCDPDDLRDYLTRLAHGYRVSHRHAEPVYDVLIVQRRTGYRCSRQQHRIEQRHRCQSSGAPHVHFYLAEHGFLFLRRVFKRHRPFRHLRSRTENITLCEVIDLYHRAVGIVWVIVLFFAYLPHSRHSLVYSRTDCVIHGRKALLPKPVKGFAVTSESSALDLLNVEYEDSESAFRGN